MASGQTAFRKVQIGEESTHGTAVAATAKLLATLSMKENLALIEPVLEDGRLSNYLNSEVGGRMAELRLDMPATYEQILYALHAGLKGNITPAQQAETTAYLWDFDPNLVASNAQDSFTIEFGDDIQAFYAEYCLARELRLSGALDEALQLSADIFGRQLTTCGFTAALTVPAIEHILMNKGKFYIDDAGSGLGDTEKAATLIAMDLRLPTGVAPAKYADGNLYFASHNEGKRHLELDLTVAFNSTINTERTKFIDRSKRFIRIEFTGTLIEGAYYKELTIDVCGRYAEDILPLEERDGENIARVKFVSCYDATWLKEFQIQVMNKVTTLP